MILRYIPHAQAEAYASAGWTLSPITGGSHGLYSVLGVLMEPTWRMMTKPAKRRRWE